MDADGAERAELRRLIDEWNKERWDMFALSEPDEHLDFHGAMKFYFHDVGQKVTTKVIRVSSTATVRAVIDALVDKFHPDMRMLTRPEYALWELHETGEERELQPGEKPLLVQLTWHKHKRDGRFLLHPKGLAPPPLPRLAFNDRPLSNNNRGEDTPDPAVMKRKLSRREKKEAKKAAKVELSREAEDAPSLASSLFSEVPPTTFTRTISNPEIVMKKRRERKLQQKLNDLGEGGSLKVYGDSLNPSRPYVTLLVAQRDRADKLLLETLDKYGLETEDPAGFCLVQVVVDESGQAVEESELTPNDCPLLILASSAKAGSTVFHVRRRSEMRGRRQAATPEEDSQLPLLLELNPDGSEVSGSEPRVIPIQPSVTEIGSDRALQDQPNGLQLFGPYIHPRHAVLASADGAVTLTPSTPTAELAVNGHHIRQTTILAHNSVVRIGQSHVFRFIHPHPIRPVSNGGTQRSQVATRERAPSAPLATTEASPPTPTREDSRRFKPKPKPRASLRESKRRGGSQPSVASEPLSRSMDQPPSPSAFSHSFDQSAPRSPLDNPAPQSPFEPPRPSSLLFKSRTLESLTKPMRTEESAMETTFDVDGSIDTRPHYGPLPGSAPTTPVAARRQSQPDLIPMGVTRARDAIPAIIELLDHAEESLLSAVVRDVVPAETAFKLAPVYTLYMGCRYRVSPHYRTSLLPAERALRLAAFLTKTSNLLHVIIQDHCHDGEALAFWMANSSELLNFIRLDRDMGGRTRPEPQESLADAVEKAFAHLAACLKEDLNGALPSFLDESLDDESGTKPVLFMLSGAMALLRQSRVNAALTIQLFSQLFHYINMYLFNWLVSREGAAFCCRSWGARLSRRIQLLQAWSLKQGLELAAECHLDRIVQAVKLLETPKRLEDLATLGSTCYKLNSLQVRDLLGRYQTEPGEAPPSHELIDNVVKMAAAYADASAVAEGRSVVVEEEAELGLPFLLPEDGYSPDLVKGIPPTLQEFIDGLLARGICRMILQPNSTGSWTVHMQPADVSHQEASTSGGPEICQITFPKSAQGGIGLSIVCAQGQGEREPGIYVKKVVPGSAADRDGRLAPGDQLLKVNGVSLQGIEQEEAARRMASSGPTVSFEVGKQAALYNGLASWLYSTSPDASPRVFTQQSQHQPQRSYTPTQHHQRQSSVSSLGGPPPSGYGRMVNGHPPPSQQGRSLSHTSLEYGGGGGGGGQGANYQNLTYGIPQRQGSVSSAHYRPPSVHGTTEFEQRRQPPPQAQPMANPNYVSSPVHVANGVMSRSAGPYNERQNSLPSYGYGAPPSPRVLSQSMDRNVAQGAPQNGIFRASAAAHSPSPLAGPAQSGSHFPFPAGGYQNLPRATAVPASPKMEPRAVAPPSPKVVAARPASPKVDYAPPPPRAETPPLARQTSPAPDYAQPEPEPYRPEARARSQSPSALRNAQGHGHGNGFVNVPVDREEAEQLEARMNEEVIRLMEEEVARLEAKEYLTEAEERRYRAIKYDLAYKRRLQDDDDDEAPGARGGPIHSTDDTPRLLNELSGYSMSGPARLAGGMDEVNQLHSEVERSLRLEPVQAAPQNPPPQKRVPPAVPPKKKTVQFQPAPNSASSATSSSSPRSDDEPPLHQTPPVDYSRRYVYQNSETETPRAQVIGAQEVYRDPRQQRLARLASANPPPASQVDGSSLNFRDKMRLFAQQLGEQTPKQGAKSSKAQREIETTILTPQN